jgi:hypothetical protein
MLPSPFHEYITFPIPSVKCSDETFRTTSCKTHLIYMSWFGNIICFTRTPGKNLFLARMQANWLKLNGNLWTCKWSSEIGAHTHTSSRLRESAHFVRQECSQQSTLGPASPHNYTRFSVITRQLQCPPFPPYFPTATHRPTSVQRTQTAGSA